MRLSLIVAMGQNRVIGSDGSLPWHLSEDLKRFKRITLGKPVIMGRKTYASIGRALPGRLNLVVTRNPDFAAAGITVAHSLAEAIGKAETAARADGVEEVFVIGGGEVYGQALGRADRLYVTEVDASPPGDARFPEIDPDLWRETGRERAGCSGGSTDAPGFSFVTFERKAR